MTYPSSSRTIKLLASSQPLVSCQQFKELPSAVPKGFGECASSSKLLPWVSYLLGLAETGSGGNSVAVKAAERTLKLCPHAGSGQQGGKSNELEPLCLPC